MRPIDADTLIDEIKYIVGEDAIMWFDNREINREQAVNMAALINAMPTADQWIPCSERLPEEDVEVLISYRYKEGEGDTSHTYIDITTYGQMYFGGNKVGNYKHWRAPFEYFEGNYEVVAWMPLPKPYAEGGEDV